MKPTSIIIVTGAPGEIANSCITRLARLKDTQILVVSRRPPKGPARKNVEFLSGVDLGDYAAVLDIFNRRDLRESKRLSLVLGAGRFPEFPEVVASTQAATVAAIHDNFLTFANCLHAAVPLMRKRRFGRIVGFSSLTQPFNYPFSAAFNAAKAACESFAASVANENSRFGIAVNMLALSTVDTPLERKLKPHGDRAAWLAPQEVAEYVEWLIRLEAPTLNGACLPLYHHSPTFFGEGYLRRISRTEL